MRFLADHDEIILIIQRRCEARKRPAGMVLYRRGQMI
jgi:hypothetical protein